MPRLFLLLIACLLLLPAAASAAEPPEGSEWHEEYFTTPDGTRLHADVLRPEGLPADAKTPVLLTVSPYTNHAGATTEYDPGATGPSDRFYDFIVPAKIFERGYTYVIVDLRGFGGSGGCNDWGGPGERMDAKAAVEWAASQPWSNGKVGIFGKSYDGWTGLMAMAERPKGLAAVLSMEPVYSGYRYLYTNGVRFTNSVATPTLFTAIDVKPGSLSDDPEYLINGAPRGCYALNLGQQQQDQEEVPFWDDRNLIPDLKGATTPLFLQQGFLETNTRQDGAFDVFRDAAGPKRAWFGQFDHVRGYEKEGDEFAVGRGGFLEEAIGFFDQHVRGDGPPVGGPTVSVQDQKGRYRGEDAWPPSDVKVFRSKLNDGTYTDDGANTATGTDSGQGIWTVSQPLAHRAWMAGEPILRATATTPLPRANLVANVYDIAPDGKAHMVSRGATLLRNSEVNLTMYGQDWVFEPGHRVGVLISSANSDWWVHIPTGGDVEVTGASIELPFLTYDRQQFLEGQVPGRLSAFLSTSANAPQGGEATFELPPALAPRPKGPGTGPKKRKKVRFTVRRKGKRLIVRGRAPKGALVSVQARRGKRVLDSGVRRASKKRRFRVTLRAARATKVVVRAAGRRVTRKVPTRTRAR